MVYSIAFFALPVAAFILQLFLCFKTKNTILRLIPLAAGVFMVIFSVFVYTGLVGKFDSGIGVIDPSQLFGVLIGIAALSWGVGCLLAWAGYFLLNKSVTKK